MADEEFNYIEEEVEEIPDIDYDIGTVEFGDVAVYNDIDELPKTCKRQKRKLKNVSKVDKNIFRKTTKENYTYTFPHQYSSDSSVTNLENNNKSAVSEGNALFDGKFFTLVGEYYLENELNHTLVRKFRGKCELCETPEFIIGTGSSTYNFLRHLRRLHGQEAYESYLSYKESKQLCRSKSINNVKSSQKEITLYTPEELEWKQFGNKRTKRPISSVVLDDGISDKIFNDVNEFLSSAAWYSERNVPYRRTYLLHGPSGCGKSSFVFALAGELKYGLCVMHASDRELTDNKLNHLLNNVPERCLVLLENIDCVFENKIDDKDVSRLTINGILNCLDGVCAPEGKIIFVTSSSVSNLDSSLLRPGRVDVVQYIGYCTRKQALQLFEKFYGNSSSAEKFVDEVLKCGKSISPAQLQGFFILHKCDDICDLKEIDVCSMSSIL